MYNSKREKHTQVQVSAHKKADQNTATQTGIKDSSSVEPERNMTAKEEFKTGDGQQELVLADHSKVLLDPDAKLQFTNKGTHRQCFLDGSALFHVRQQDGKDFLLSTDKLDVRVTGTIFEVRESSNQKKIDIFVEEGRIEVFSKRDKSRMQVINAGECFVYNVKQDKFHQKNTSRTRLKFKGLKSKFKTFFEKD
jgi:transmembrane sensor